jgi:hypothetical protein
MSDDPIKTIEVVLARVIDADGRMSFHVSTQPPGYNDIEVLGLLSAGTAWVQSRMKWDS